MHFKMLYGLFFLFYFCFVFVFWEIESGKTGVVGVLRNHPRGYWKHKCHFSKSGVGDA